MYVCDACGLESSKWEGRCRSCGEWNSLREFREAAIGPGKKTKIAKSPAGAFWIQAGEVPADESERLKTGIPELDHLLGGGLSRGSVTLLSGEPGIGKSTLLLHLAGKIREKILYIAGEETLSQIKNRIQRLGISDQYLLLSRETNVDELDIAFDTLEANIIFVDSVQNLWDPALSQGAGGMAQLRTSTARLVEAAKRLKKTVLATGHINKLGEVAGPKVIEHLVDATLLMDREEGLGEIQDLRVIRPLKNRFGPTDTAGVFLMNEKGLLPYERSGIPSESGEHVGSVLYPHFIGKRLFFSEIEALVVKSDTNIPRRSAEGLGLSRLLRLAAILEKYAGCELGGFDLYVNVSGGIRNEDIHMDLAILAAIYSSLRLIPLPRHSLFLGEVGLSGRIKAIRDPETRSREIKSAGPYQIFGLGSEKPVPDIPSLIAQITALRSSSKLT